MACRTRLAFSLLSRHPSCMLVRTAWSTRSAVASSRSRLSYSARRAGLLIDAGSLRRGSALDSTGQPRRFFEVRLVVDRLLLALRDERVEQLGHLS